MPAMFRRLYGNRESESRITGHIFRSLIFGPKPDAALVRGRGRRHQALDCVDNGHDLLVVTRELAFEFGTTKTLISTARGVFRTEATIMAPCSVKA
jgi:hypothetical protein